MKERKRSERDSGMRTKKSKDKNGQMPAATTSEKQGAMNDIKKALKKAGKKSAQKQDDLSEQDGLPPAVPAHRKEEVPALPYAPAVARTDAFASESASTIAGPSSNSIAFSSLDFTPSTAITSSDASKLSKKARLAMGTSTRTGVTSHDPTVAIDALNKREDFLAKLTPQARERAEEKDKWDRMGMRAEGTKVYDEEAKLKKMVKRKEKANDKSRKDW